MRILHTEASCGWGGQEIRILTEAQGMIAAGHEVSLVCPLQARILAEAPRFGVPVTALPIARKNLQGVIAMRSYLRSPAGHKVEIINSHSSTDSWLSALALLGHPCRAALVRTRHVSAPVPNNLTTRWLYRTASKMVVTTGASLREQLIVRNGLDPARVVSVPTGIDLSHYHAADLSEHTSARNKLGVASSTFLVGIVATLRSWKGHRYLVDAIAELQSTPAERKLQLMIVGDGPQRASLEAQIKALNLGSTVRMVGNQDDVVPFLHAFDAFVLPSYANEGVPQALLQAMACKVPVVTTNAGAIGEVAQDNVTALLAAKESSQALAQCLRRVVSDPGAARARAQQAYAKVSSEHSLAAMLEKMQQVFRSALKDASH